MSLMILKRDTGGNLILAAYHPEWSITWSWILRWNRHKGGRFLWWHSTHKYREGIYGEVCIGRLGFTRQPTMLDEEPRP